MFFNVINKAKAGAKSVYCIVHPPEILLLIEGLFSFPLILCYQNKPDFLL